MVVLKNISLTRCPHQHSKINFVFLHSHAMSSIYYELGGSLVHCKAILDQIVQRSKPECWLLLG